MTYFRFWIYFENFYLFIFLINIYNVIIIVIMYGGIWHRIDDVTTYDSSLFCIPTSNVIRTGTVPNGIPTGNLAQGRE